MALSVATGSYVGNGATSGTRAITGVGFQPKLVIVFGVDGTSNQIPYGYSSLPANYAGLWSQNGWITASTSDRFYSYDADGFTISCGSSAGTNQFLNQNGVTFYYVAVGGDDIYVGSYTGNATDNRSITGVGFQPIYVHLMGGTQNSGQKFDSSGATTDTYSFSYAAANVSNGIQKLEADGFQIGTSTNPAVNANGTVYYYYAIKAGDNVYQGEYTGNATDNRAITGFGSAPVFAMVKSESAYGMTWRTDQNTGDESKLVNTAGLSTNRIQSFDSDGMTIGTANEVNANGAVYCYIAFTEGAGGGASGPASLKTWNGTAKASLKTIDTIAIASTKTFNTIA